MAELAVFGLAVNILSVIDYGTKCVASAWSVYTSGEEGISKIASLRTICEDLTKITTELAEVKDERLLAMAQECNSVAQKILHTLENLHIPEKPSVRFRPSFFSKQDAVLTATVATFKLKWKDSNIKELEEELSGLRKQLEMNVAMSFRSRVSKTLEEQATILATLQKNGEDFDRKMDGFGSVFLEILTSKRASLETTSKKSEDSLRRGLIKSFDDLAHESGSESPAALTFEISSKQRQSLEKKFISRLRYNGMYQREETVAEAHVDTFRWLFERPETRLSTFHELDESEGGPTRTWNDFGAWLQSDEPLYSRVGSQGKRDPGNRP